ncbi:hypothetical protein GE09DRAFT_1060719 [Coniochaeta sp. 2T2.1]|nr:hypothetical protein GE09DRAFT_1060719 [Coniochaeta sp. 2T2.1]
MATITVNRGAASFTIPPIMLQGSGNILQWGKMLMLVFRILKYDHFIATGDRPYQHTRRYQNRTTGRWFRIDTSTKRLIEFNPEEEKRDRHAAMLIIENSIPPEVKKMLVAGGYDDTSYEPDVLYRHAFKLFHWEGEEERERERELARAARVGVQYYDSDGEEVESQETILDDDGNEMQFPKTFLDDDSSELEEATYEKGEASGEKREASGEKGESSGGKGKAVTKK